MLTSLQNLLNKKTNNQLVFLWLIVCFFALSYKLGEVPPYHSDENYYVESVRTMLESGDYLTPMYHDEKRFAKPILYYWLMSVSYKIFGVSLVSARLTSVFFGTLTIALLYFLSNRLFEEQTALYSALVLPAMYMHFQISRWATTDIVMNFFILLSIYYFLCSYKNDFKGKAEISLFYLAAAMGFMTKGPPAVIIPILTAVIFLLITGRGIWSKMQIGKGLVILALVILPWFSIMFFLHGDEFKNHIVGAEITNRLVHDTPFSLYFFGALFRYNLPWILFFLVVFFHQSGLQSCFIKPASGLTGYLKNVSHSISNHIKVLFRKVNEPILFCYIWIFVCLALFTIVRTEHSRYMLPASPAVAMIVAKFFSDLRYADLGRAGYKLSSLVTAVIFFGIAITSGGALYVLNQIYDIPYVYFLLSAVFLVAGICIIRLVKKRQYGKQVFVISFSLVFAFSFLSGEIIPHINRYPMKKFSTKIIAENNSAYVAVYQLGNQRARLGVLTGQKVFGLSQPNEVQKFVDTDEQVFIVMREKSFKENFSSLPLKVLEQDIAWLRGDFDRKKIEGFVSKGESGEISELTEKIYLLSNK